MADLGRELYAFIYEAFSAAPPAERRLSHWVMDTEWQHEIRKTTDQQGHSLWPASDLLFGLPVVVTEDGGIPHLEPDAVSRMVTTALDGRTNHGH